MFRRVKKEKGPKDVENSHFLALIFVRKSFTKTNGCPSVPLGKSPSPTEDFVCRYDLVVVSKSSTKRGRNTVRFFSGLGKRWAW